MTAHQWRHQFFFIENKVIKRSDTPNLSQDENDPVNVLPSQVGRSVNNFNTFSFFFSDDGIPQHTSEEGTFHLIKY